MSGIIAGEKLRPVKGKIGGLVDTIETEIRIQRTFRHLPPAVLYDVGTLRLVHQSHLDAWLNGTWNEETITWVMQTHFSKEPFTANKERRFA